MKWIEIERTTGVVGSVGFLVDKSSGSPSSHTSPLDETALPPVVLSLLQALYEETRDGRMALGAVICDALEEWGGISPEALAHIRHCSTISCPCQILLDLSKWAAQRTRMQEQTNVD